MSVDQPDCPHPEKISYRSQAKAERANRDFQLGGNATRYPGGLRKQKYRLYPYECPCGAWHLTHLRQRWGRSDQNPSQTA